MSNTVKRTIFSSSSRRKNTYKPLTIPKDHVLCLMQCRKRGLLLVPHFFNISLYQLIVLSDFLDLFYGIRCNFSYKRKIHAFPYHSYDTRFHTFFSSLLISQHSFIMQIHFVFHILTPQFFILLNSYHRDISLLPYMSILFRAAEKKVNIPK